jgi:hypothetical protein
MFRARLRRAGLELSVASLRRRYEEREKQSSWEDRRWKHRLQELSSRHLGEAKPQESIEREAADNSVPYATDSNPVRDPEAARERHEGSGRREAVRLGWWEKL